MWDGKIPPTRKGIHAKEREGFSRAIQSVATEHREECVNDHRVELARAGAEQLGSGNAWTQIRDLNPDVLKGGDKLRVDMRLRIPNKPVASAAH